MFFDVLRERPGARFWDNVRRYLAAYRRHTLGTIDDSTCATLPMLMAAIAIGCRTGAIGRRDCSLQERDMTTDIEARREHYC